MMEEMSLTLQCDMCDVEQMSEEEILACLVADTEPEFPVSLPGGADSDLAASAGASVHDSLSWVRAENFQLVWAEIATFFE